MIEPLDVLVSMAHPDDAELLCGATLIKCADLGLRTGVLDLTRGEAGSAGTPEIRAGEAEEAAAVMGLAVRRNAGLPDSRLQNDVAARARVAGILRELRPRIVITHWGSGRHPDHRAAAAITYDAAFLAGLAKFDVVTPGAAADGPSSPHRPHAVVYATAFREDVDSPSFVVDVTDQIDRKIEAIACYASQFTGKKAMGEIFGGGTRTLYEQVRMQAAHYGSLIRTAYGEPFRLQQTLELESPAEVNVSSF